MPVTHILNEAFAIDHTWCNLSLYVTLPNYKGEVLEDTEIRTLPNGDLITWPGNSHNTPLQVCQKCNKAYEQFEKEQEAYYEARGL